MLELQALGPTATILLIIAIAGVVSWGITQLLRVIILRYSQDFNGKHWFVFLLRFTAMIAGGLMGYILLPGVVGAGLGLSAGVLNTTIVAIVKSKLKTVNVAQNAQTPKGSQVVNPDEE